MAEWKELQIPIIAPSPENLRWFIGEVNTFLADQPQSLRQINVIISEFRNERIAAIDVVMRLRPILILRPQLVLAFNLFLPTEFQYPVPEHVKDELRDLQDACAARRAILASPRNPASRVTHSMESVRKQDFIKKVYDGQKKRLTRVPPPPLRRSPNGTKRCSGPSLPFQPPPATAKPLRPILKKRTISSSESNLSNIDPSVSANRNEPVTPSKPFGKLRKLQTPPRNFVYESDSDSPSKENYVVPVTMVPSTPSKKHGTGWKPYVPSLAQNWMGQVPNLAKHLVSMQNSVRNRTANSRYSSAAVSASSASTSASLASARASLVSSASSASASASLASASARWASSASSASASASLASASARWASSASSAAAETVPESSESPPRTSLAARKRRLAAKLSALRAKKSDPNPVPKSLSELRYMLPSPRQISTASRPVLAPRTSSTISSCSGTSFIKPCLSVTSISKPSASRTLSLQSSRLRASNSRLGNSTTVPVPSVTSSPRCAAPGTATASPYNLSFTYTHVINYFILIKNRLGNRPLIYNQFINYVNAYHNPLSETEVCQKVEDLIKNEVDLLLDFKKFLPYLCFLIRSVSTICLIVQ